VNNTLETIKIRNAHIYNIYYHQQRFDKTRADLYSCHEKIDLKEQILKSLTDTNKHGLFRCRIVYNKDIESIDYIPYKAKKIEKLKVISSNIEYNYKYENRSEFDSLLQENSSYNEVIIEKDGYITDTTISNIAFYDGEKWLTPKRPLLKGSMREKLLDNKFLTTADIKKQDINKYIHVALINAMLGFKVLNKVKIYT